MESVKTSTLKQLEQILAKRPKYVVKQVKQERRDLGDNPTQQEIFLVLQTMIKDLQKQGIFK